MEKVDGRTFFMCSYPSSSTKTCFNGALTKGGFSNWKEKYGKEKNYFFILLWESTKGSTFPNLK